MSSFTLNPFQTQAKIILGSRNFLMSVIQYNWTMKPENSYACIFKIPLPLPSIISLWHYLLAEWVGGGHIFKQTAVPRAWAVPHPQGKARTNIWMILRLVERCVNHWPSQAHVYTCCSCHHIWSWAQQLFPNHSCHFWEWCAIWRSLKPWSWSNVLLLWGMSLKPYAFPQRGSRGMQHI